MRGKMIYAVNEALDATTNSSHEEAVLAVAASLLAFVDEAALRSEQKSAPVVRKSAVQVRGSLMF